MIFLNVSSIIDKITSMLAEHFSVSEFRCKCGGTHDTIINPELPEKLERLFKALNCSAIVINSGYRCPTHSVNVGGSATDFHTKGYAADIVCYDQSGNKISSKKVSCAAQDVGFDGIANIDSTYTATHVDVRTSNFWKGDEVKTSAYSVTDDFYKYYNLNNVSSMKKIEKTAEICYNENNYRLKATERRFFLWNK